MRRRWLGGLCLLSSLVMLLAGETLLRERLRPVAFLVFWLGCFIFAALALLLALLEVSAIRRRIREEQRTLFETTLQEIARRKQAQTQKGLAPDETSRQDASIP